ncbi:hypothetical protein Pst134EB_018401 [Puccinia striiformis f. sp. tritici]|nr:hypothetical protein Pst134EB_018401 [Puccinia striiformis f. sp. tritici]
MESDPLFPPDFPTHLRRFTRHITAVQTRGIDNSSTDLLFATHASDHTPPPSSYAPAHDSYDLQLHPVRTFRPNLLIDNIERLFISVVPLWSAGINEVTRLTTWSDPNRTAVWALLYSLCWWYELVLPAILALIICLSVWPKRAGSILFPPEKVTLPLTGDRARTQDKPELTDPSSDEVAEAAAAAAATFIHGVDSQVPLGSPSTEGSMKMQADSLEKASSKLKEPKAEKRIFHNNTSLSFTSTAAVSRTSLAICVISTSGFETCSPGDLFHPSTIATLFPRSPSDPWRSGTWDGCQCPICATVHPDLLPFHHSSDPNPWQMCHFCSRICIFLIGSTPNSFKVSS